MISAIPSNGAGSNGFADWNRENVVCKLAVSDQLSAFSFLKAMAIKSSEQETYGRSFRRGQETRAEHCRVDS